eukprot:gene2350-8655_t
MSAFSLASDFASLVAQWVPGADPAWMATTIMVFVPIWFLGTITGLMLPRPKWLSSSSLSASVLNLGAFKQLALTVHGFFIVRECWYRVFEKGTFRQFLKAVSLWLCGQGWTFDFPHARDPSPELKCMSEGSGLYVTHSDLDLYKTNVKSDAWELMMEKTIPNVFVYKAWRRTLPDSMISSTEVLESGDFKDRQMPAPEQIPLHADSSLNRGAGSAPSMRASDEHVCGGDTTDDESDSGYGSEDDEAMSEDDGPAPLLRKKSSMLKGVATFAIAGGLAVIMRKNNCPAPMRTLNRNDSQISAKERFPNNRYRRSMFK